MYSKLQYISQGESRKEQLENISSSLDAGCKWIQLRFKQATEKDFMATAEQVKLLCEKYEATFIINDLVSVADKINADGVHLGLTDSSIAEARNILGNEKIIGGTANTLQDVLKRIDEECDYIGLGPFRFTTTKNNLSPILGITGYQTTMDELKKMNLEIPVYAIGGIETADITTIIQTGVHGIAVSGLITKDSNKKELVEQINSIIYEVV
jgi:thiamine-phosphate pyrophosphorylase